MEGGASRRWAEAGVAVAFVSLALAAVCSRADASRIPTVQTPPNLPQVIVPSDNIRVTSSCRLILAPRPIPD